MKSKVYCVKVQESDAQKAVSDKLRMLLEKSQFCLSVDKGDTVALKIHFGEEGNAGFVKPDYTRVITDCIARQGASCFLSDTNTLYRGRRTNCSQHMALAYEHGFTKEKTGVDVIIPDDTVVENRADVAIKQKHVEVAKIAKLFLDADSLVGITHFKGHMMTGFGGALKNIGMGCATREGKLAQHSDVSPVITWKKCVACGACVKQCPVNAISINTKNKADIDNAVCVGCASCIAVCPESAIDVNWHSGSSLMQEKMVEYAYAVLKDKKEKSFFLNFVLKITQECDCLAKDDPRIAPDIGILASVDPVSIDKASFDLVRAATGKDVFREVHPKSDGMKQLIHAQQLGLGSLEYELIKVNSAQAAL